MRFNIIDHVEEQYELNPSLYFQILEENEDKHEEEVDGTYADEDQIDDVTLFKKTFDTNKTNRRNRNSFSAQQGRSYRRLG